MKVSIVRPLWKNTNFWISGFIAWIALSTSPLAYGHGDASMGEVDVSTFGACLSGKTKAFLASDFDLSKIDSEFKNRTRAMRENIGKLAIQTFGEEKFAWAQRMLWDNLEGKALLNEKQRRFNKQN